MVDETAVEVIPYDISEAHTDAELITQAIEEWQDAMGVKIIALIRDET